MNKKKETIMKTEKEQQYNFNSYNEFREKYDQARTKVEQCAIIADGFEDMATASAVSAEATASAVAADMVLADQLLSQVVQCE